MNSEEQPRQAVRWCVQNNLGSARDLRRIEEACAALGHIFEPIPYIPFSVDPPDVDDHGIVLFYGSPNLVNNVLRADRWNPGAFWDDDGFRYSTWSERYGADLLNAGAEVRELSELVELNRDPDEPLFLRPDRDLKEFAGTVMTLTELRSWYARLMATEAIITPDTEVVHAPVVSIDREWRVFVCAGEVVAASLYRVDGELQTSEGCPTEVVAFVERLSRQWTPAEAFVMDVALSDGRLAIIELNGVNSSGFYAADVLAIVDAVSRAACAVCHQHTVPV